MEKLVSWLKKQPVWLRIVSLVLLAALAAVLSFSSCSRRVYRIDASVEKGVFHYHDSLYSKRLLNW